MLDVLIGIGLLSLGIIWFVYHIKNLEKWDNSTGWIFNYQWLSGSIMTILLGLAFIFGLAKLDMLF